MHALLESRLTLSALLIAVLLLSRHAAQIPQPHPGLNPPRRLPPRRLSSLTARRWRTAMEDGEAMVMESGSIALKLTGI